MRGNRGCIADDNSCVRFLFRIYERDILQIAQGIIPRPINDNDLRPAAKVLDGYGTIVNNPEELSTLNESTSYLNASDRNFEDNLFSVELFVNK
jgi:hypothetical protein